MPTWNNWYSRKWLIKYASKNLKTFFHLTSHWGRTFWSTRCQCVTLQDVHESQYPCLKYILEVCLYWIFLSIFNIWGINRSRVPRAETACHPRWPDTWTDGQGVATRWQHSHIFTQTKHPATCNHGNNLQQIHWGDMENGFNFHIMNWVKRIISYLC